MEKSSTNSHFTKKLLEKSQYHNFLEITSKVVFTVIQIVYHFFTFNIHN